MIKIGKSKIMTSHFLWRDFAVSRFLALLKIGCGFLDVIRLPVAAEYKVAIL